MAPRRTTEEMKQRLKAVLEPEPNSDPAQLLADYLDAYDGRWFERYGRNERSAILADDVVAVTMLSMKIGRSEKEGLTPDRAVQMDERQPEITACLEAIPAEIALEDFDRERFDALLGEDSPGSQLWSLLREQIGIGRVATHKLLARKRPAVFPIRDSVSDRVLRTPSTTWESWWATIRDPEVAHQLTTIRSAAGDKAEHLSLLRVADIVVWMHG